MVEEESGGSCERYRLVCVQGTDFIVGEESGKSFNEFTYFPVIAVVTDHFLW